MAKRVILVLAGIIVGCAAGMTGNHYLAAQQFAPNPAAQKWQQFCELKQGWGVDRLNEQLAQRGAESWELVGLAGSTANVLCFRRPAP